MTSGSDIRQQAMADSGTVVPISELNRLVRLSLEREFPLLWVAGEISNLTRAASGHVYFSLKDEFAQARCVMFRSRAQNIPWRLENGQQVEARALVSLYEPRGDFQLSIEALRRAGLGRLFEAFARLRTRLEEEGMFAAERKRTIPRFPRRIGIISSPHAAALHDILVTIRRRAPHLAAILYPTPVQGENASAGIAEAIATAGRRNECDLLLVVRGGGSIEDLWAFNAEIVARAICASPLPTISGVGHETDTTITDYVADLRAPTPTAAAEIATQGWHQAAGKIAMLRKALGRSLERRIDRRQQALDQLSLRRVHPATRIARAQYALTMLGSRLNVALIGKIQERRKSLSCAALGLTRNLPRTEKQRGQTHLLSRRLDAAMHYQQMTRNNRIANIAAALAHLNPEATLARGFSIVRDDSGRVITDPASLHVGQVIQVRFALGRADASIVALGHDSQSIAG